MADSKVYECNLLFQLMLQLMICGIHQTVTVEDNYSVQFLSSLQVNTMKSFNIINYNQEDHLYGADCSLSCSISNGSDFSWYFCVNENCTSIKKLLLHNVVHCSPSG